MTKKCCAHKQREQLSAQIGEAKRGLNIPDRDLAREKAVFDHAMTLARTLDLPQGLAAGLQQRATYRRVFKSSGTRSY